jgi:hypothetical protein
MKIKGLILVLVMAMLLSFAIPATPVSAVAYGTDFVTSITYMNVGTGEASINFTFYAGESGTGIPVSVSNLAQYAASSLYVGSLSSISSGFQGSGIISSSQPLVATLIQVPQSGTVLNRPLSNGFESGSDVVKIPTVLKNFYNTNTMFSIQNVDSVGADITVEFVPAGGGSTITDTITNLPAGSAKYYDMGTTSVISAGTFNGSVVVTSVQTGTSTPGSVVATSLEMSTINDNTYAFEGVTTGGATVYMPSAFCNWGSGGAINSAFAVQNIDASATAQVTVDYAGGGSEGPIAIGPGAKYSFLGCTANSNGYIGSATITATGADIVAVGKIYGNSLSTAYVGLNSGFETVALPYVRWTESNWTDGTRQRVNFAIQNVGSGPIAAGDITVEFYDAAGTLQGTINNPASIAVGGKWSTNASSINAEFGYVGGFGGGAIVKGPTGAELAVIARAETYLTSSTTAGEDYNGISISP